MDNINKLLYKINVEELTCAYKNGKLEELEDLIDSRIQWLVQLKSEIDIILIRSSNQEEFNQLDIDEEFI